uniref:Uncharacterized protein n=1 Tax=Arundo donax TaxID=35708 RepID=A0A0A9FMC4_ARUDO
MPVKSCEIAGEGGGEGACSTSAAGVNHRSWNRGVAAAAA